MSPTATEDIREVAHRDLVWRSRSDFVIAAAIEGGSDFKTELIWALRDGELFEICCIPFFICNLVVCKSDGLVLQKQPEIFSSAGVVESTGNGLVAAAPV